MIVAWQHAAGPVSRMCVDCNLPDVPPQRARGLRQAGGRFAKSSPAQKHASETSAGNQTKPSQTTTTIAHLRVANLKGRADRPSEPPWSHDEPLRGSSLPQLPPSSRRPPRETCKCPWPCSRHRTDSSGNRRCGSRDSQRCQSIPLQKNHKHRLQSNLVE